MREDADPCAKNWSGFYFVNHSSRRLNSRRSNFDAQKQVWLEGKSCHCTHLTYAAVLLTLTVYSSGMIDFLTLLQSCNTGGGNAAEGA